MVNRHLMGIRLIGISIKAHNLSQFNHPTLYSQRSITSSMHPSVHILLPSTYGTASTAPQVSWGAALLRFVGRSQGWFGQSTESFTSEPVGASARCVSWKSYWPCLGRSPSGPRSPFSLMKVRTAAASACDISRRQPQATSASG